MPRVNRDLQRRLAARRERERRRPSGERRYRFETPEPALETDEALAESNGEVTQAPERPLGAARPARATVVAPTRGAMRDAPRPFSAYREEYAYVYGDLRRVGAVIGGLLVVLIVLYFALPLLVH
jgi:hypothetical protein